MTQTSFDPRQFLRGWLPHILLLGLVVGCLVLVAYTLAPLGDPILLAISLAALTSPLVFEPSDRLLCRMLPKMNELLRRQIAGIIATIILVLILITPLLALILTTVGGVQQAIDVIIGIGTRNAEKMTPLFLSIEQQTDSLLQLYPSLPFEGAQIRQWLEGFLTEASDLGTTFLSFMFRGTSSLIAHLALALFILPSCYAQGGLAARFILSYTPLSDEQSKAIADRHHSVVKRLLSDTLLFALCRGVLLGGLAWLFVGIPLVPVVAVATFLSLVPAVGTTMVWLPLVIILWTTNQYLAASIMTVCSLGGSWGLSYVRSHVGQRIDEASGVWLSFLLFMGLAAGLLTFGMKGFVIGPMLVVAVILVFAHLLPFYGLGKQDGIESDNNKPTTPPA